MARHLYPECLTIRALNLIHGSDDYDRDLNHLIGSLEGRYGKGDYENRWRTVTGSDEVIDYVTERRVVNALVMRKLDRQEQARERSRRESQRLYEASLREAS